MSKASINSIQSIIVTFSHIKVRKTAKIRKVEKLKLAVKKVNVNTGLSFSQNVIVDLDMFYSKVKFCNLKL